MGEKIVIDFGSEKENERKEQERIVIEFDDEKKAEEEKVKESTKEKILNSKINSFYFGNANLTNFFESELKFPEGIEQSFRKKFSINLKDEFFNSILENNKFIILSSKNSGIYLIDRFEGKPKEKLFFEGESFEKTGFVYENKVYVNSLKKIYRLDENPDGKINSVEIYRADKEKFIWSNLNRYKDYIVFTQFNPVNNEASLKSIDIKKSDTLFEYNFESQNFLSDKICIANGSAYVLTGSNLLIYHLEKGTAEIIKVEIKADENSFIFYLNYRLYITSQFSELYYLDIPSTNYKFKFSGIKVSYMNSIGGFDDNIFIGTLDGWRFYKSSGLSVYNFEDEYENKIECIGKNVLVISQKNKIVFCNLNRFQEVEGYVISSNEKNESVEIVSSVISDDEIFILTKNGTLEAFTNDKLNIHI